MSKMNFAIYYVGDGYSTDKKIMGRQSAGKALMKGVARRWKTDEIHGFGAGRMHSQAMYRQLHGDGFTGALRWREAPGDAVLDDLGAVYFPGPLTKEITHWRNSRSPSAYSLFGVTHTLSSAGAMDQIGELILPPFKPWDALICTSTVALDVVNRQQDELRTWYAEHLGATRFNAINLPVIPLGIDAPTFTRNDAQKASARQALGLAPDDVAFLFAGRLTFHAKANPAAFYQALEAACVRTDKALVCVEAGVYPNMETANVYEKARRFLAPSARFIYIDGQDEVLYHQAWKAADVFVSLSDNIQETFGLTPLEAMASGIPVIVSDWDGYKDTVRDGVDGYRIPVTMAPPGSGEDLAKRHALGHDTYDYYIGRVSMATTIDIECLTDRVVALAEDGTLRRTLGNAGRLRAHEHYDWPVILGRYVDLVETLGEIRRAAGQTVASAWPGRPDPFKLFESYPTQTLNGAWRVEVHADRAKAIEAYLELEIARYVLDPIVLPRNTIMDVLRAAEQGPHTVDSLIGAPGVDRQVRIRALMWLHKLNLINLRP